MVLQRQSPRGKHGRPPPRGLPHGAVTALGSWARASGSCRRRGGLGGPFRALLVVHQLPMVHGRPCAAPSLGPLAECSDRSPRLPRPRVTVRTPVGPQSCFRASFEVGVTCSSGAFSWQAFTGVTLCGCPPLLPVLPGYRGTAWVLGLPADPRPVCGEAGERPARLARAARRPATSGVARSDASS